MDVFENKLKMVGTKTSGRPGGHPKIALISKIYATGPKSEEGKKRSSQNSFKHGLFSKNYSIAGLSCTNCDVEKFCSFFEKDHKGCGLFEGFKNINFIRLKRYDDILWQINTSFELVEGISVAETVLYGSPKAYTLRISKKIADLLYKQTR